MTRQDDKSADETTHFGFEDVRLDEKQARVDDVFHKVAGRYDVMNDLMSAGLHQAVEGPARRHAEPAEEGALPLISMSRGARGMWRFASSGPAALMAAVTVLDINADMLGGRTRCARKNAGSPTASPLSKPMPRSCRSRTRASMAIRSPSASATCRASTCALAEAYPRAQARRPVPVSRILAGRPARPRSSLYDAYSFNVIPRIGQAVTGDGDSYQISR